MRAGDDDGVRERERERALRDALRSTLKTED